MHDLTLARWLEPGRLPALSAAPRDAGKRVSRIPNYDPDALYGIIPDDIKPPFQMREVIAP